MQYDIIPINKKVVLKKVILEQQAAESIGFAFSETTQSETEYYEVLEMAVDCVRDYKTEIVTVENCRPLGKINGIDLFVCDEKEITCRIFPKNEIKDRK